MHTREPGIMGCSGNVPIDVAGWMATTGQKDVLVLSRCKNFGDGMGGSGEGGIGRGRLWALGSLLGRLWAGRRAAWLWRGSGRLGV